MRNEFQNIEIPEELNQVVKNSMNQIYTQQRRQRIRKTITAFGATAAVFTAGIFWCKNNPTLAANLPVIGHIFERMQESFSYKGDYTQIGEALESESVTVQWENIDKLEEMEGISSYSKTADGLTVTLSEVYCNDQAIYVTVQLKSEEMFPEVYGFEMDTVEQYSFNPSEQYDVLNIEGEFIDEYTYAGMIRFDLNTKNVDATEGVKIDEIPDSFILQLDINLIHGALKNPDMPDYGITQEEWDAMSEDEWHEFMKNWYQENPDWVSLTNEHQDKIFRGNWEFTIEVNKNLEDTQIVEVNEINDLGIGIEKVVKDRFEITMYEIYPNEVTGIDYFPVMLDADGILMDYGRNSTLNTVAINDRNVSKVDIFLIDYYKWMDELKGDRWRQPGALTSDGKTYKELLLEECAFHTEVIF